MKLGKQPILVLDQDCSCSVIKVTDQLNAAGFTVVRSFDLQSALAKYRGFLCQMIVLLAYSQDGSPATLILDGNHLGTSIFLENDPEGSFRSLLVTELSKLASSDQF
jgi:hypothetical protein